jgi:aspartokinase/homoserine dehydrogenase 1
MNILKFGGTSVGSAASIQALMDILRTGAEKENSVVVISAFSGVTNALIQMAEQAALEQPYAAQLKEIESRHYDVVRALLPASGQNPVFSKLKIYFNELEDILQSVATLKELSHQTRDLILSYGERCSTFSISHIARQYFPNVLAVDGSALIRTDSNFGQAKVDFETTDRLIQEFNAEHPAELLFVTGFISSNAEGRITTLGRGGSDYTASIWGAALSAQQIQIWTDVDGMLTADPRIVDKAFSLSELSYTEAMELSYFGAKVIYPPTMAPAFAKKIPIVIKNTFNVDFEGTYIRHDTQPSALPIKGISSINDISILNISGSGMVGKAGFSGRLFSLLSREQINVVLITQSSSEHSITFAVKPDDGVQALNLIYREFELELQTKKLDYPEVESGLSILAIVGENMKHTPGMASRLFNALGRNGVNVRAIAQGSSEHNISVILSKADLSKAVNAVHDAFYSELKKTLHVFCLGTGNIGKTLFSQLQTQMPFLASNNDLEVKVTGISNSRRMIFRADGLDLANWQQVMDNEAEPADLAQFIKQMKAMNLPNCVFVDNTASAAPVEYYEQVLQSSISVVTCNKIGNSGDYSQYLAFKHAARTYNADFYYETNVGAGLPIIRTLKDLMLSGDKVSKIEAILSGTISYIFNNFTGDRRFHEIVREAQAIPSRILGMT